MIKLACNPANNNVAVITIIDNESRSSFIHLPIGERKF